MFRLLCSFFILYYDQQMHNYFTNYHIPACFGTIIIKIYKKFCRWVTQYNAVLTSSQQMILTQY